jgi:hypothetical protein
MLTLFDIEAAPRRADGVRSAPGMPVGYPAKGRLLVPQAGKLVLPKDVEGLRVWANQGRNGDHDAGYSPDHEADREGDRDGGRDGGRAPRMDGAVGFEGLDPFRTSLLTRPSFVAPLPTPDGAWFASRGIDTSGWRSEAPRHLLLATRVDHQGRTRYGAARTLFVENGLGFGSTSVAHHEEVWLDGYDSFADHLALQVVDAVDLQAEPEGNGKPWTTVMLLLNDQSREPVLPTGWQHALALVAGLYRVKLTVYAGAWASRARIVHEMTKSPPDALLVADGSIAAPEAFLAPFRTARPHGYADTLRSRDSTFEDQILDLGEHLKLVAPRDEQVEQPPQTWSQARDIIESLECESFVLTSRARTSLVDNPYPDPARMTWHVRQLAALAAEFASQKGVMGQRLADEARRFEIEIAMHDAGLSPNSVAAGGENYPAEPHVKVDDVKTADKCGRIYFAIDPVQCVFIVDHIGLHDYP